MPKSSASSRPSWSSKFEFLLTCVGYAVGLGNIWRFPYLCFKNGGGAFLVPYLLTLLLCGLPIAFLEFSMGQYVGLAANPFWDICPLFKGMGIFTVLINIILASYYVFVLVLAMRYFVASFSSELPWQSCNHEWNTDKCFEVGNDAMRIARNNTIMLYDTLTLNNTIIQENATDTGNATLNITTEYMQAEKVSAAEEYLINEVLSMGSGVSDLGIIKWQLWLPLLVAWLIIYIATIYGVKSSGKVVYFTATFPYIMLTVFVIRGSLLPGSLNGIIFYIVPKWERLKDPQVWYSAAQQMFNSLGIAFGCFITMSSYNKFNNNCLRDAVIATLVNSATSIYAGFAVFSVIGFMAHTTGLEIDEVMQSGPGLAFIAYPQALATMAMGQLWSVMFFLMLITLGLSTEIVHFETIVSCIVDRFPVLRTPSRRAGLALCLAILLLATSTIYTTQAGMYIFTLVDWYGVNIGIMIGTVFECVVFVWIYGLNTVCDNIYEMINIRPNWYFKICWRFIAPGFVMLILIVNILTWSAVTYGDYIYPAWTTGFGWTLAMSSLVPIPVVAVIEFGKLKGLSFKQKLIQLTTPTKTIQRHITLRSQEINDDVCEDVINQSKSATDSCC